MRRNLIAIALTALLAGCASPQPETTVTVGQPRETYSPGVLQTLQDYRVGKTTFADFQKDAGLVLVKPDASADATSYKVALVSLWKIYGTSDTIKIANGKSLHTRKFTVGDRHQPLSVLIFDDNGTLASITPALLSK